MYGGCVLRCYFLLLEVGYVIIIIIMKHLYSAMFEGFVIKYKIAPSKFNIIKTWHQMSKSIIKIIKK